MRRAFVAAAIILFLIGVAALLHYNLFPPVRRAFSKYVCSPVPGTVQDLKFEGNDFAPMFPCECFLRFSASSSDLRQIIQRKGLEKVGPSEMPRSARAPS